MKLFEISFLSCAMICNGIFCQKRISKYENYKNVTLEDM